MGKIQTRERVAQFQVRVGVRMDVMNQVMYVEGIYHVKRPNGEGTVIHNPVTLKFYGADDWRSFPWSGWLCC